MPRYGSIILLISLVALGVTLAVLEPADRARILDWGEALAGRPWAPIVMILAQATLFTLAMPGSLVLWMVAPFYHPVHATLILVTGTVAGALGAYAFAAYLGQRAKQRVAGRKTFRILERRGDFMTQCALRVLPGFPHAIVNYGAGVLHLPLWTFTLAALCGMTIKWGVYTTAIHGVVDAEEMDEIMRPATFLPLMALTIFLIVGSWASRRIQANLRSRN